LPPAAAAPPLPQAVVQDDPPRGRVGAPAPVAPPAAATPPPPVATEPHFLQAPDSADITPPPADAPRVQLTMLMYSRVPERRTVALVVDGGSMTMLHEGESTHEIEVERIKPDGVLLRHRGRSFTVRPRD